MSEDELKQTFGKIPQLYDEVRPGYPAEIYTDTLALLKPVDPLNILEIGCGTGKGTEIFANHGHSLLAIDISAELIAIAKQRFAQSDSVSFQVCSFEHLDLPGASVDLIFSAQAFHWVDPEVRFKKSHYLLAPGGVLAIFHNVYDLSATPLLQEVRRVCLEYVPVFSGWPESSEREFDRFNGETIRHIDESGLFEPPMFSIRTRTLSFSPEKLVKLLVSFSWFQTQKEDVQRSLLERLAKIPADTGDIVGVPTKTVLIKAVKN